MLIPCKGDLFASECETFVNAVNCQGPMGGGIALEFKRRYPEYYDGYHAWLNHHPSGGDIHYFRVHPLPMAGSSIISIATKELVFRPSRIEWVATGLHKLVDCIATHKIPSIAIPALGCGLGGLEWSAVKPLIQAFAEKVPQVVVEMYAPL